MRRLRGEACMVLVVVGWVETKLSAGRVQENVEQSGGIKEWSAGLVC